MKHLLLPSGESRCFQNAGSTKTVFEAAGPLKLAQCTPCLNGEVLRFANLRLLQVEVEKKPTLPISGR